MLGVAVIVAQGAVQVTLPEVVDNEGQVCDKPVKPKIIRNNSDKICFIKIFILYIKKKTGSLTFLFSFLFYHINNGISHIGEQYHGSQ